MPASQYGPAPEDHDGYPSAGDHRRLARTGGLPPAVATYKNPGQPPWASRPPPPRPNNHIVFDERRDNGWNNVREPPDGPSHRPNGSHAQNHYPAPVQPGPSRPRPVAPPQASRPPQPVVQHENKRPVAGPSRQPEPIKVKKRPIVPQPWKTKTEKRVKKKHYTATSPAKPPSPELTEEEIEEIEFNSVPIPSRAASEEPECVERKPNIEELERLEETPYVDPEDRTEGTYWVRREMIPAECYQSDVTKRTAARNRYRKMKGVEFGDMGRDTSGAKWRDDGFALDWSRRSRSTSTPKAPVKSRTSSPTKAEVQPSPAYRSAPTSTVQAESVTPSHTKPPPTRSMREHAKSVPVRTSPVSTANSAEGISSSQDTQPDPPKPRVNPDLVELLKGSLETLDQAMETRFNELTKWTRLSIDRPHHSTVISHHIDKTKAEIFAIDEEIEQRRAAKTKKAP